jgi:hypothetical protein
MPIRQHRITPSFCALLGLLLLPAMMLADTGVGVDTWRGNKLDPNAGAALQATDERGTSWLQPGQHRSPSGNLYMCPAQPPTAETAADWEYNGVLQIGYLGTGGDDKNALWNRYVKWNSGLVLGLFDLNFERDADGSYAEIRGSRISAEDQYYQAVYGRAGSYKIQAFIRDMPNVLSNDARPIWNGVGSNNLTLPSTLVAGGSTPAQVAAVAAATPERTLEVMRQKQGIGYSGFLTPQWISYINITDEQRRGERAFGGPMYFNYQLPNDGGALETVKPINDSTVNINGGFRFSGKTWRMDFGYVGSFYRDAYTSFSYQTPFSLYPVVAGATSAPLTQGQFATEPDNNYHNLQATFTRRLPMNGELSLSGSAGRMTQNDALIAPINCQGVFGIDSNHSGVAGPNNPLLYSCAQWNTSAALSRQNADMRIDSSMLDARIVLQPSNDGSVRGGVKFNREDYRNTYVAYNPLAGQYGYPIENGSQGSIVPGLTGIYDPLLNPSAITRIMSLPLDEQTIEGNVGADWKVSAHDTLGATFNYRDYEPSHRERSEVRDNSIKLTWVDRAVDWLTLRANYTFLRQSGDSYNYNPYDFLYSNSLPGFVAPAGGVPAYTVEAMRAYDLSDRDENKLNLMATIMPRADMTISLSLRGDWNNYEAQIGRQKYDTMGLALQWEWQPSPTTTASAYYGQDRSRIDLANVDNSSASPDPTLGGAAYPNAGRWWVTDRQKNSNLGITLNHQLGHVRFDANWNYLNSRGLTKYRFNTPAALAYFSDGLVPGDAFPAMSYRVNSITVGATIPLMDRASLRIYDYYERGAIGDWHYLGFDQGLVYDHRVYSDGGPQSYSANLIGLLLNIRL